MNIEVVITILMNIEAIVKNFEGNAEQSIIRPRKHSENFHVLERLMNEIQKGYKKK